MALVVHADAVFAEHLTPPEHPERPERVLAVLSGLQGSAHVARVLDSTVGDLADVKRVHDPAYVEHIRGMAEAGGGALDPDTWISNRSFDVAIRATGTICKAVDLCLDASGRDPARRAFCVLRPPGHHARPAGGMGFCLFNNVAVAAARARLVHSLERVAIIDFDVHHGNGTQDAFWRDGSVFFASLHRDRFYPGTGKADETGEGRGKGATFNLPLPSSTTSATYREAFERTLEAVSAFAPQLLLVSAGFDAYRHDPVGGLGLGVEDYTWIGEQLRDLALARCDGRVVAALEGGYALDALPDLSAAFVDGLGA